MVIMVESCDNTERQGTGLPRQPVQKLGYSSHTAWVMAIMSGLAYMRFEEEALDTLLELPAELAKAVGRIRSDAEAQALEELLATRDNRDNRLLRDILAAGGFQLLVRCRTPAPTPRVSSPTAAPVMKWTWPWSASGERRTYVTGRPT